MRYDEGLGKESEREKSVGSLSKERLESRGRMFGLHKSAGRSLISVSKRCNEASQVEDRNKEREGRTSVQNPLPDDFANELMTVKSDVVIHR